MRGIHDGDKYRRLARSRTRARRLPVCMYVCVDITNPPGQFVQLTVNRLTARRRVESIIRRGDVSAVEHNLSDLA